MTDNKIEEGDVVTITFMTGELISNARILSRPADVGDCWRFVLADGSPLNVMFFETMSWSNRANRKGGIE